MLDPVVTTPTELPISLARVKAQAAAEDFPDDDRLLKSFVEAATAYLDGPTGVLGRAIMPQTVVQQFCDLYGLVLPYGPALSVTSVTYYDTDNVMQTLTGWQLMADERGSFVYYDGDIPQTYDRPDAVTVTYQAGYADAASVPETLKLAIANLAATWYCFRESNTTERYGATKVPYGFEYMIAPFRVGSI